MFSSLRGFLNRHRRKFAIAGLVVGGAAIGLAYARRRLLEWQESETRKFLEATRKRQHYENTQVTYRETVLNLYPSVPETVMKRLDADEALVRLRGKNSPKEKLALWDELKVVTFARASALVYALTVLTVTLRVQLNVLGGYLYRDSTSPNGTRFDEARQKKYLAFCRHFFEWGIDKLCGEIRDAVEPIVEPLSLKRKLSLKDVEQLFWSIQAAICTDASDPLKRMITYLVDPREAPSEDEAFRKILDETIDLLEWEDVKSICISSVSRGFSVLMDAIAEGFDEKEAGSDRPNGDVGPLPADGFVEIDSVKLPLAKIIPIVNASISRQFGVSDVLVHRLIENEKLQRLGANIYESFSSS